MHLHVAFQMAEIQRDLARHVMRALDQIGHHDDIAYAPGRRRADSRSGPGRWFSWGASQFSKMADAFHTTQQAPSHRDATEPALPGGRRSPGESAQGFGATPRSRLCRAAGMPLGRGLPIVERMALFQRVGRRVVAVEVVRMDVVPGRDGLGQAADDGAVLQDLLALGMAWRASLWPRPSGARTVASPCSSITSAPASGLHTIKQLSSGRSAADADRSWLVSRWFYVISFRV